MSSWLIGILNAIIRALAYVLSGLLVILPPSPFLVAKTWVAQLPKDLIDSLNWIIPVSDIIGFLASWCACILLYYIVQIAMRWVKAIK